MFGKKSIKIDGKGSRLGKKNKSTVRLSVLVLSIRIIYWFLKNN